MTIVHPPGGRRRRPLRGWLRRRRPWSSILLGALVLWLVVAVVQTGLGVLGALHGRSAARAAMGATSTEDIASGVTSGHLRTAAGDFSSAAGQLGSPALAPFRLIPVLGRQLDAARIMSVDSAQVARTGAVVLDKVAPLLHHAPPAGPDRVSELRSLAADAASGRAQIASLPSVPGHLIGPVASLERTFSSQVQRLRTDLQNSQEAARAAADLLAGPHNYLLLAANNAEMRAGSGMFLSAAVLSTNQGRVAIGPVTPTAELLLPPGAVPISGALSALWGWAGPSQDWRNLAMSPRFDAIAPVAVRMWQADAGQSLDGVMVVDAVGLQDLLAAVGPVTVNGHSFGADRVLEYVMNQQYAGLDYSSYSESQTARRDLLGSLAKAAVQAAQDRSISLSKLGRELGLASGGRHLMIWSADPAAETAWQDVGIAGAVGSDDVMVAVLNRGANKLDQFLQTSVDAQVATSGSATTVTLTVHLHNTTPPSGQSPYVVGPPPNLSYPPGDYSGILALTMPGRAGAFHVTGGSGPGLVAAGPDGQTQVRAVPVNVLLGSTQTVQVSFTLAGVHGSVTVAPSARQPAEQWDWSGSTFSDSSAHVESW